MFKIYSSRNEYIPSRKHESNVQENVKMELNFMFIFQDIYIYVVSLGLIRVVEVLRSF